MEGAIEPYVAISRPVLRPIAVGLALILIVLAVFAAATPGLTHVYFLRQDNYVLAGLMALLLTAALPRSGSSPFKLEKLHLSKRVVIAIAALMTALLWGGTHLLLDNYPLTRDEHMVVFDMAVFRAGRLAAPLSLPWRPFAEALTPAFLLPLPGNTAWVSAYMPGNAMLRTAFAAVFDPALMNPLLAAIGATATFDVAQRLFPEKRSAQAIAVLMYVSSAQILVTAMTTYAMTAHLALNMVWLALYLRGTRKCHAAAIAVGFVAIGLHQVIFHPLFALPFIDRLRQRGEWRTAAIYTLCYAGSGLFWLSYPHIVAISVGLGAASGAASGSGGFLETRVVPLLLDRDPQTFPLMAANLIRFVTWENLALMPLAALGMRAVRRNEGIARALLYGALMTLFAMALLLPYQGHGWGYRYLHGLIGNCILLAAYGWSDFSEREEVRGFVLVGSLATVFGSLPFLLWQTHKFVHPYAEVNRMIGAINADMVVVETEGTSFAIDEVRNEADLTNRPIRLSAKSLTRNDIAVLCQRGSVAFVGVTQMQSLGLGVGNDLPSRHFRDLRQAAMNGCGRSQRRQLVSRP